MEKSNQKFDSSIHWAIGTDGSVETFSVSVVGRDTLHRHNELLSRPRHTTVVANTQEKLQS